MTVQLFCSLIKVAKGKEFTRRNGDVDNNYTAIFEHEGQMYSRPTTKEVFEKTQALKTGEETVLVASYNEHYKFNKFVVVDALV